MQALVEGRAVQTKRVAELEQTLKESQKHYENVVWNKSLQVQVLNDELMNREKELAVFKQERAQDIVQLKLKQKESLKALVLGARQNSRSSLDSDK